MRLVPGLRNVQRRATSVASARRKIQKLRPRSFLFVLITCR